MGSEGKQKTTYDFKTHVNTDVHDLMKVMVLATGNVHDSQVFTELLSGDEEKGFADSAYASEKKRTLG